MLNKKVIKNNQSGVYLVLVALFIMVFIAGMLVFFDGYQKSLVNKKLDSLALEALSATQGMVSAQISYMANEYLKEKRAIELDNPRVVNCTGYHVAATDTSQLSIFMDNYDRAYLSGNDLSMSPFVTDIPRVSVNSDPCKSGSEYFRTMVEAVASRRNVTYYTVAFHGKSNPKMPPIPTSCNGVRMDECYRIFVRDYVTLLTQEKARLHPEDAKFWNQVQASMDVKVTTRKSNKVQDYECNGWFGLALGNPPTVRVDLDLTGDYTTFIKAFGSDSHTTTLTTKNYLDIPLCKN